MGVIRRARLRWRTPTAEPPAIDRDTGAVIAPMHGVNGAAVVLDACEVTKTFGGITALSDRGEVEN